MVVEDSNGMPLPASLRRGKAMMFFEKNAFTHPHFSYTHPHERTTPTQAWSTSPNEQAAGISGCRMAVALQPLENFWRMSETRLRQWVEANPGRVEDRDIGGHTPLSAAASHRDSQSLVVWLLEEKGADVNALSRYGLYPSPYCSLARHCRCLAGSWRGSESGEQPRLVPSYAASTCRSCRCSGTPAARPPRPRHCQHALPLAAPLFITPARAGEPTKQSSTSTSSSKLAPTQ